MNGMEAKDYAKKTFEDKASTQHRKLDALYYLVLNNSDVLARQGKWQEEQLKPLKTEINWLKWAFRMTAGGIIVIGLTSIA